MDYINNLIPSYLITLLTHSGFDNLYSLSQFNINEDIEKMETYSRDVLSKVLKGEEKKKVFGIFSEECMFFRIPEGHKNIVFY